MELRVKPAGIIALLAVIALICVGVALFSANAGKEVATEQIMTDNAPAGEVVLASSKTKKDWLDPQAEIFNKKYAPKATVRIDYAETRDTYQDIINGKAKPALWAPSSTQWVGALDDVWKKKNNGKPLYDTSNNAEYKIYIKTPMVILTTKDKAKFLQDKLGGAGQTFENLRALSSGKMKCPWGAFKYSYADPINAGSGFMVVSMFVADYQQKHLELKTLDDVVHSAGFKNALKELNTAYVYDEPAFNGSGDLFKSFITNKTKYDFIITYESNALKEAAKDPNLAVVYPNPTGTVDMSVIALTGANWISTGQKNGARAFMQQLGEPQAIKAGVETDFRTAFEDSGADLTPQLNKLAGQGFRPVFTPVQLPPYAPVNEAASEWRQLTKASPEIAALQATNGTPGGAKAVSGTTGASPAASVEK